MARSPLQFLASILSKTPSTGVEALAITTAFPDQSIGFAIAYVAVALGLISWESCERLNQDQVQDTTRQVLGDANQLTHIQSLLAVDKNWESLVFGHHQLCRFKNPLKIGSSSLMKRISILPKADERRPQLVLYRSLLQIVQTQSTEVARIPSILDQLRIDLAQRIS